LLTKKDFSEDGARRAIRAFRDTITLAKPNASGYSGDDDEDSGEDMDQLEPIGQRKNDQAGGAGGAGKHESGVFSMTVPFAKGSIAVQVRVTGDAMSPAHLARVRRYLELAEQDWNEGGSGD
jgi:hypothetical protein